MDTETYLGQIPPRRFAIAFAVGYHRARYGRKQGLKEWVMCIVANYLILGLIVSLGSSTDKIPWWGWGLFIAAVLLMATMLLGDMIMRKQPIWGKK